MSEGKPLIGPDAQSFSTASGDRTSLDDQRELSEDLSSRLMISLNTDDTWWNGTVFVRMRRRRKLCTDGLLHLE
jgi:hypothetical protein